MMHVNFKQIQRAMLFFILLECTVVLAAEGVKDEGMFMSKFHDSYSAKKDPNTRRELVIQAIDSGIIKRGKTKAEVKELFGSQFIDLGKLPAGNGTKAVVFFSPAIPPANSMMSAIQEGWYIDLQFDGGDKLENYSLSNLHK